MVGDKAEAAKAALTKDLKRNAAVKLTFPLNMSFLFLQCMIIRNYMATFFLQQPLFEKPKRKKLGGMEFDDGRE